MKTFHYFLRDNGNGILMGGRPQTDTAFQVGFYNLPEGDKQTVLFRDGAGQEFYRDIKDGFAKIPVRPGNVTWNVTLIVEKDSRQETYPCDNLLSDWDTDMQKAVIYPDWIDLHDRENEALKLCDELNAKIKTLTARADAVDKRIDGLFEGYDLV